MRFSARTPDDLAPNRLAAAVGARAGALCDLTTSNPTQVGLVYPTEALAAALGGGAALPYQPAPRGSPSAREAVAGVFAERGARVDPDAIVLTASTSEAYGHLFKLLCDAGDEVLVPQPSYPLFDQLARLEGVSAQPYRLGPAPGFALDPDRIEVELGPRTRAVVLVSPNNPTGSVAGAAALDELGALCAARGVAVISDEVFAEYPVDGRAPSPSAIAAAPPALTFSLGGLSKSCGLPHYKLGWLACAGPEALRSEALARLDHIADSYLSPATPVMAALPALMQIGRGIRASIAARVADNRRRVAAILAGHADVTLLPAEAGWTAVLALPPAIDEEETALALLERDGVLVHPGYFFDFERGAHIVVSLLVLPADLERGLRALEHVSKQF